MHDRRHPRRRLRKLGLGLALLLVVGLLVLGILQTAATQRWILRRAGETVSEASGLQLVARELRLSPLAGRAELRDLRLGDPGAEAPFASAERLLVDLALLSLLAGPLTLDELRIEGLVIDLAAPLHPRSQPTETEQPLALAIRQIALEGAVVRNLESASPALGEWLGSTRLTELTIRGQLSWPELDLTLARGSLELQGGRLRASSYALAGHLAGSLTEELRADSVQLDGAGLRLAGDARWAITQGAREATFDLETVPALLLADAAGSGEWTARGRLDLRHGSGSLESRIDQLAWEIVERAVPQAALPPPLPGAGTTIDAECRLELSSDHLVRGPLSLSWQLGGQPLLAVEAQADPAPGDAPRQRWAIVGELLPEAGGRRHFDATIDLDDPTDASSAELTAQLAIELPDLASWWIELERSYPELELPDEARRAGRLSATLEATGPLLDPITRAEVRFQPAEGGVVDATGSFRLTDASGQGTVRIDDLPLRALSPEWSGSLAATAELRVRNGELRSSATLQARQLVSGELHLDRLEVEGRQAGQEVWIDRLEADRQDRHLTASGRLTAARPFDTATLSLHAVHPVDGVGLADLRLALAGGVLHIEIDGLDTAVGRASGRLLVPLGSLASIPGVAGALEDLPLVQTSGPVEIELYLPELDTDGIWPALQQPIPGARLQGALNLSASARLDAPARSTAVLSLRSPELEIDGIHLSGTSPLQVELRDGALTLAPHSLAGAGVALDLEANAQLQRDWSLDRPLGELLGDATLALGGRFAAELLREGLGAHQAAGEAAGQLTLARSSGLLRADLLLAPAELHFALPPSAEETAPRPLLLAWTSGHASAEVSEVEPLSGRLRLQLEAPLAVLDGHRLEAREPLLITYQDGHGELLPWPLSIDGEPFELAARLDLDPSAPLSASAIDLGLEAHGEIAAAVLEPFLLGAAADGRLRLDASLHGPADRLSGEAELSGDSAAELRFLLPYLVRISEPRLALRFQEGTTHLDRLTATVNDGQMDSHGQLAPDGAVDLSVELEDVRLRVDYGVSARLDADLRLDLDGIGAGTLSGTVVVDRAALTRDLDLEKEVLGFLLPADLAGTTDDPLDAIALDVEVSTVDGVRVKNNVADLRATWSPLRVRGTLASPAISGIVAVDPGGLVYAYGQTVRLDQAELIYSGDPLLPPQLELTTTSGLEDPSIEASWDRDLTWGRSTVQGRNDPGVDTRAVGGDLAGYLGGRLAGQLNRSLSAARLELRPLIVYDEVNPDARLTVARQLSGVASFGLTIDLRDAQRRTYLLDVYDLPGLPRLTGRAFTTDSGGEGAAVQQTLEWGGTSPRHDASGSRLRRVVVPGANRKLRRLVRRAVTAELGKPLPDGAAFDAEIDVEQELRRRGWADPRVNARVEPHDERRSDLIVDVELGPRAHFAFSGDHPPRPARRSIRQLYRADSFEDSSLDEMRLQAERFWRGRGYLRPHIELSVELDEPAVQRGSRTVTIDTDAGLRTALSAPLFPDLQREDATQLAGRFLSPLARAELALGLPSARVRLERGLHALGYAAPQIGELEVSDEQLVVHLDPGERQTIGAIAIVGLLEVPEASALIAGVTIQPGEAARRERIAAVALSLEQSLEELGYLEARVTTALSAEEGARELQVVFEAQPGVRHRLTGVALANDVRSRARFVETVSGLERGEDLGPSELQAARRRLFSTGLFSAVRLDSDRSPSGDTTLRIDLRERPPWSLAYGFRWSSDDDASVVVDVLDRNVLGRGLTLGARGSWSSADQRLRMFGQLPRLFGSATELMLFAEGRREVSEGIITDSTELSLQLGHPLGSSLEARIYGRYRNRHFTEEDPDPFFPLDERVRSPFLGVQLLYDRRDDPLLTSSGLFWSADLSGSDEVIGSDFRYLRLFAQLSTFRPIARWSGRELVWAQSIRLGAADSFDQELLRDLRFFAGGEFTVRGYRRDSLGPVEVLGSLVRPLGGQGLLVISEELRMPLWGDLSGLLFFDAGNVWERLEDFDGHLSTSLGLGLRALTPLGLLRLDVGFPLDRRPEDDAYQLLFGFGSTF